MPRRFAFSAALLAILAAAPAAAQTDSAGIDDRLSERVTEAEERQEVALTDLLNRLARQGFADIRSIRPEGDAYIVEAVDRELTVRRFRLDPASGTIAELP